MGSILVSFREECLFKNIFKFTCMNTTTGLNIISDKFKYSI